MVHVFQLDLLTRNYLDAPRHSRFNFPLWWSEGLAELWSGGQDARDEMVLRDLTMTGRLPPLQTLSYVTSPIVYPIGGQIHRWLADTYGDWRMPLMYKEQNRYETFEAAIKGVYGRSLEQLDQEFQLAMRRRYYPSVDSLAPLSILGREVARLAVKPTYVPDSNGGQVAYLSPEQRLRRDLSPLARRRLYPHRPHRRSQSGVRGVPRVRLPDGRQPARSPPVHRAVRRPRRAGDLGPRASPGARPVPLSRDRVAALARSGCPTDGASC